MTITLLPFVATVVAIQTAEVPELASMALLAVVLAAASVVLQRMADRDKRDHRARRHGVPRAL